MAIVQISKIQHRTGANTDLPQLSEGEIGFATDDRKLFIGNDPLLHPPANSDTTTQTEILTEVSPLNFRRIEGSANTGLNVDSQTLENGQVLVVKSNTWVNGGGNAGGLINLGYLSNVKVLGGVNGYTLQTDGLGNLSWGASGVSAYEIADVSTANPAVVTTIEASSIITGVAVTIVGVDGMTELATAGNGGTNKFYAIKITDTSFSLYQDSLLSIPVDSSSFTATVPNTGTVTISLYASGSGNPGGSNTQVQFNNDSGMFGGSPNFTFVKTTNTLTVGGNIVAANVNSNTFGSHNGPIGTITPNTGSFTSVTASSTAVVAGNLTAGNIKSNGVATIIGNLSAGNIDTLGLANVGDLSVSGNVTTRLQPDANSTLDLGSVNQRWKDLYLSGNSIYIGNHSIATTTDSLVFGGNIMSVNANLGNLATANFFSGILTKNDQPNITSVGTLASLVVTGSVDLGDVGNLYIAGGSADYVLSTDGQGNLLWKPSTSTRTPAGGENYTVQFNKDTVLTGDTSFSFSQSSGTLTVPKIETDGGLISNISAANVIGTVSSANTVTNSAQPNITSVGTLTRVTVSGNADVQGTFTAGTILAGVANLKILGGSDGYVLRTDGYGSLNWAPQSGGGGGEGSGIPGGSNTQIQFNDNGTFAGSSNFIFDITNNTLTVGNANLGNLVTANFFSGDGGYLSNLQISDASIENANYAAYAGNIINAVQPNITTVGVLTGLVVNGDLSVTGKVSLDDVLNVSIKGGEDGQVLITDGYGNLTWSTQTGGSATPSGINTEIQFNDAGAFAGDANLTFNKSTGTLTATLIEGTLITSVQTNITSVGTLTSLAVTNDITSGNANLGNLAVANYFEGTLITNAQPNITSVGILSELTVQGNLLAANGNLGNLAVANYFQGTLITNAQPNITSVGTLTGLNIDCKDAEIDAVSVKGVFHSLYTSTDNAGITLVTGAGQTGTGFYFFPNNQWLGIVNDSTLGAVFTNQGHLAPYLDKRINLGDPTSVWKNAYLGDLHLNNARLLDPSQEENPLTNPRLGGDWSLVAGTDGLYLYDNFTNNVYQISMTQVVTGAPDKLGY